MSDVKRFQPERMKDSLGFGSDAQMHESAKGDWVKYEDFAALEAENARLTVRSGAEGEGTLQCLK